MNIKCTNPFCQYREEYNEYQCYCPKCGYSQAAGNQIRNTENKKDISDAKKYAYRM